MSKTNGTEGSRCRSYDEGEGDLGREELEAIENSVQMLRHHTFASLDIEDIEQEVRLMCLQAIRSGKFNPERQTLSAFLYVWSRSKLLNMHRNLVRRTDGGCTRCRNSDFCEPGGCKVHKRWERVNNAKASLSAPNSLGSNVHLHFCNTESQSEIAVSLSLLDERLPAQLRTDWLQMRDGVSLPASRRIKVEEAVASILGGEDEDEGHPESLGGTTPTRERF